MKLLRTREVAERASVSLVAVLHWVRAGKLHPVLPVVRGQSMLFDAREVEAFLRSREEKRARRRT
ncbi:MAG: helix-turn-helix domain-containing protein [Limnochordaceae bacterium]|nr:helix-turn-helix domain-containing protein [Limnochordaceae bacterium]